jgi:Mn-dependent DtxR family transcriptional regulator
VAVRRAEELAELLKRQGPMSQKEIAETTGWGSDSVVRCLQRLANDGRAHPTGGKRGGGRGSPEWAAGKEGSGSPEQWASVPTTDGAEADQQPDSFRSETEEVVDDQARDVESGSDGQTDGDPWVNVPDPDEEPGRKLTSQERGGRVQAGIVAGNEGLARRVEEACTLERRTVAEIAGLLGEEKRLVGQMVKAMERVGRIESRGGRPVGAQLVACYQRRLRPEEDPSITIRQADRTGSVESRVVAVLEQDERLTVEQLAAALVLHPRIVAQAVSTLRGEGRVEKLPGGAYQLAEDTRAVT